MKRIGVADTTFARYDMAAAAIYLCSDEASMVTGVAMEVDGGRCI